ncbi:hypothetical protein J437_LFUL012832, partial [Ladona fulva]
MKKNKSPGADKINGEIIKVLEGKVKDTDNYESGRLPEDFERSTMVAIPRKTRAESNFEALKQHF